MLSNQLSARELFSNNSCDRYEYNEVHENSSQLQNSQYDFSQYSQDFMGNSSGSEKVQNSQGRKLFDRFMAGNAKQSKSNTTMPFGRASEDKQQSRPSTQSRPNFLQQLQMNKAKAKDRDEKDHLVSIVKTVKECSEEVKEVLKRIQSSIGKSLDSSDDKLSGIMNFVSECVNDNYEKMLKAVQERDERRTEIQELMNEVSKKDVLVSELQKQVSEMKDGNSKTIIQSLKEIVDQHQALTDEKLKQLLEISGTQIKNQEDIIGMQTEDKEWQQQQHLQLQNSFQRESENAQTRICETLEQLRDEMEKHKSELEDFYLEHLRTSQNKYMTDIQSTVESSMEKQAQAFYNQTKEVTYSCRNQMRQNSEQYQRNMETYIKDQFQENHDKQIELLQEIQANNDKHSKPTEFDYHESIPKNIQEQLDTMRKNFRAETDRLQKQFLEQENENKTSFRKPQVPSTEESETQNSGNYIPFSRKASFISPGIKSLSTWNSKSLFSKTYPSPVATVHPQPQEQAKSGPVQENQRMVSGYRPTKGESQPQRRSQRLLETKNNSQSGTPTDNDIPNQNNQFNDSQHTETSSRITSSQRFHSNNNSLNVSRNETHQVKAARSSWFQSRQSDVVNTSYPKSFQLNSGTVHANAVAQVSQIQEKCNSHQYSGRSNFSRVLNNVPSFTSTFKSSDRFQEKENMSSSQSKREKPKLSLETPISRRQQRNVENNLSNFTSRRTSTPFSTEKESTQNEFEPIRGTSRAGNGNSSLQILSQDTNFTSDSSRDSSPSMSVTRIVISKNTKCKRSNSNQFSQGQAMKNYNHSTIDDFLNSFESDSIETPNKKQRKSRGRGNNRKTVEVTKITKSVHDKKKQHIPGF